MVPPQRSATDSSVLIPSSLQPGRPPSHSFSSSSLSIDSTTSKANSSQLSINTLNEPLVPPPPLSKVFNRQRSGSAPSPIQVVLDEDLSEYNISIRRPGAGGTPGTGNTFTQGQEFPETAKAPWSAAFSPVPPAEPLPEAPMSAAVPGIAQPNAAQQLLLNRAASSARARHSRQSSLGNLASYRGYQPPASLIPGQRFDDAPEVVEPPQEADSSRSTASRKPVPKRSLPPSPNSTPQSLRVLPSQPDAILVPNDDTSLTPLISTAHANHSPSSAASIRSTDSASTVASSQLSARPSPKSLPPIPPSTPHTPAPVTSTQTSTPPLDARGPRPRVPQPLALPQATVSNVVAEGSSPRPDMLHHPEVQRRPSQPSVPPAQEASTSAGLVLSPPLPLQSSRSHKSTNTIDELLRTSAALGSPPPYYTVVDQNAHPPPHLPPQFRPPPVASSSSNPHPAIAAPTPSTQSVTFTNPFTAQPRESTPRSRARPAGPMGPRGPSMQGGVPGGMRDRSASNASLVNHQPVPAAMTSPQRSIRRDRPSENPIPPTSPKFQPPPVKHRGYTMEAAKWTFSSTQLQGIVSKAIKESAQTSSIRLLKLESLESEIPDEIHRLEMHRTDVKSKYKALTRRRATLFESLTFHLTSSSDGDSTFALRITEELSSIARNLDELAEELHATDYELAQLNTLVQVHSKSALSMALRKLNASFLKQMSDNDILKERITALEAERDEAWKHAEDLANEYDHLQQWQPPSNLDSPASASNRSSRVSAKRKSSIRVSKAGLRIRSRRQSARSSVASSAMPPLSAASSRSPFRLEKVPPIPPIPKRRPADIITDYHSPSRGSPAGPFSMEGTPNTTDSRALDKAEEELYSMLGLSVPDSGALRRSRSMVGHLPSAGLSPPPISAGIPIHRLQRRSSLPGAATLVEAQNAMNADRNAVVFTFEMLQDVEDGPSTGAPYTRHFKPASPFPF
ncbi:hypothetical protein NMY22_g16188 [Coprinellus aureogranulatus]|nr:hypothetical protein NMY22_g16188 [Coprinellus aureogranulatus]